MVPFGGWEMPVQYSGIVAEHRAVRSSAGLFDISHMARVSFGGPDALKLLESVFTNSVAGMKDGQVRYGLVCNADGGTLDDILVYRWPYGFAAVINASNREKILAWLKQHAAGLDVQIMDQTLDTAMVAIQGPQAIAMCAGMFEAEPSVLRYYFAMPTRYRNTGCVVSRTGYTGEDGYEIIVPNALGVELWNDLISRGAVPCGLGARDTLRLEAGMPLYGHELTEGITPIQAGLGWAVKFGKGGFIGRKALELEANDATHQVRVGLELDGKRAAREGSQIMGPDDEPVGIVTSGSFCPWLEKSLAMGYVKPAFANPGTPVDVDIRGTPTAATVVPLPFYKRQK
jgi:aminomethyltransferase